MEVAMDLMEVQEAAAAEAIEQVSSVETGKAAAGQEMNENGAGPVAVQADALKGHELAAVLEALLFVSAEPVPVARLATVIGTVSKAEVEQALKVLQEQLAPDSRGIQLVKLAGGYRLVTKADYAPWLKRLDKAKAAQKLSRSALESLAIIAYKQPLVRAEIEEIRGVETSGVLRTLLERKLVRIVGRKEVPGRPIMYGTTKFFLEHFGLQDLGQLPPLREFKELGEAEQALLPIEETTLVEGVLSEDVQVHQATESSAMVSEEGEAVLVGGDVSMENQLHEPLLGEPVEQA
jgi:segregation and condensation protein B